MDSEVKIEKNNENKCYISKKIMDLFLLNSGKTYKISFGNCNVECEINVLNNIDEKKIILPNKYMKELNVTPGVDLNISVINGKIVLGPVIGVFINPRYLDDIKKQDAPISAICLVKANEIEKAFVYFFSIGEIDWLNKRTKGWYFCKNFNKWRCRWVPLPDVLYDRGVNFYLDEKKLVNDYRKQFKYSDNIHVINSRDYLDKYWLYEKIKHNQDIIQYLPYTIRYDKPEDILKMLYKYKKVYLKSFYGSRGTEVLPIELKDNFFVLSYYKNNKLKQDKINENNFKELIKTITYFFKDVKFVIQQGVNLLDDDGCLLDMRILLQKNEFGKWVVSSSEVRKGEKKSLITNESRGGICLDFKDIMPKVLSVSKEKTKELEEKIHHITIKIAKKIEKEYGDFGELGMDMALDEKLNIWFIEANSKPDKDPASHIDIYNTISPQFLNTILYSKYLKKSEMGEKMTNKLNMEFQKLNSNKYNNNVYNTVIIPEQISNIIKYPIKTKIKFGLKEKPINLIISKDTKNILCTEDVLENLGIIEGKMPNIKFDSQGNIKIGPYVGVFVNKGTIRRINEGTANERIINMAKASNELNVITYFFTIDDVDWWNKQIVGRIYNYDKNVWEIKKMPFPNVLYDRGGGFLPKQLEKAKYIRKQMNGIEGIKKINEQHYFSKWENHKRFIKYDELAPYLPETILYNNNDVFEEILDKYKEVYLKTFEGSNGKEIIRVKKHKDNEYEYDFFCDEITKKNVDSINILVEDVKKIFKNKKFLIQQGIDVLRHQNNKIDIRVLVQKNGKGDWVITSMPVRIANNDCPITSTRSGADTFSFEHAFREILKFNEDDISKVKNEIQKLCYMIIKSTEKEFGTFGELGIDIAVDQSKNVWFIEVNAKPGKDTIMIVGEDVNKAYSLPFEYAKYLSGFNYNNKELANSKIKIKNRLKNQIECEVKKTII